MAPRQLWTYPNARAGQTSANGHLRTDAAEEQAPDCRCSGGGGGGGGQPYITALDDSPKSLACQPTTRYYITAQWEIPQKGTGQ